MPREYYYAHSLLFVVPFAFLVVNSLAPGRHGSSLKSPTDSLFFFQQYAQANNNENIKPRHDGWFTDAYNSYAPLGLNELNGRLYCCFLSTIVSTFETHMDESFVYEDVKCLSVVHQKVWDMRSSSICFKSLWLSDNIWRHWSWSSLRNRLLDAKQLPKPVMEDYWTLKNWFHWNLNQNTMILIKTCYWNCCL